MKKIVLGILIALFSVSSVKAEMLYTVQGQMGVLLSRWYQSPHHHAHYNKRHPPIPPLAPWYTYWPGATYQAPPGNQPGNGQLDMQNHPNYFYYHGSNSYIYPAR